MSELEEKILEPLKRVIPALTESEQEKLLAFGEGMAFMADQRPGRHDTAAQA